MSIRLPEALPQILLLKEIPDLYICKIRINLKLFFFGEINCYLRQNQFRVFFLSKMRDL